MVANTWNGNRGNSLPKTMKITDPNRFEMNIHVHIFQRIN
jgi:hypothetical protein